MAKLSDLAKQVAKQAGNDSGGKPGVPLPVLTQRANEAAPIDPYGQERPANAPEWDVGDRPTRFTDLLRNHLNPRPDGQIVVATVTFPRWLKPSSASVVYRYDVGFEIYVAQSGFEVAEICVFLNWLADVADNLTRPETGWFDAIVEQSKRGYLLDVINEIVVKTQVAEFIDVAASLK